MKTLKLAFKLFRKKLVLNIVLILQLAIVAIFVVVAANAFSIGTRSVNIFKSSDYKIFYDCYPAERAEKSQIEGNYSEVDNLKDGLWNQADSLKNKYPWVKGVSEISTGYASRDKTSIENLINKKEALGTDVGCQLLICDELTAKTIHWPLAKGKQLSDYRHADSAVPVLLGGMNSGKYRVGQKFDLYVLNKDAGRIKGNTAKDYKKITVVVAGIMAKPEMTFDQGIASNMGFSASQFFQSAYDIPLMAYISDKNLESSRLFGFKNFFVYTDKNITSGQEKALKSAIEGRNLTEDTDIVKAEEEKIEEYKNEYMPFLIVLSVVATVGIISMCMLTTMSSMKKFSVYYLLGSTWNRNIITAGLNSLIYFVISMALFVGTCTVVSSLKSLDLMVRAYFSLSPFNLGLASLICLAISAVSFLIPLFILRRKNPIELLAVEE